jgi:hypothetical protein
MAAIIARMAAANRERARRRVEFGNASGQGRKDINYKEEEEEQIIN